MSTMDEPPDTGNATPPLATQLVQTEQKQVTEQKHSELPTHSRELIIANLRKLSDSLSTFQRCLTGLRLHIDSSCNSIHSFSMLMLPPPYTTNTNSLSPPAVSIPEPEPSPEFDRSEEEEEEEEEEVWYFIIWIFTFGYQLFASVGRQVNFWCPQEIKYFHGIYPKTNTVGVKGNVINAIDIAYTFGFEEKLDPLGLLTSFLKESEETLSKKIKGFKQTITVRAAKKRYLFDLKSVYGCLKRHRIDPSKLVPGWQFNVKIMSLEQEIAELNELVCQEELAELVKDIRDQKMAQKRKIDETESSGCFSNKEMKNSYFPNP